MQRKTNPSLNQQNKNNIKSSFISQYSPEHKQKTINLTSHKHLSSSTFLDLEQSKNKFATNRKLTRKETQYLPLAEQVTHTISKLTRARSLKNIEDNKFKSMQIIDKNNQIANLNQNTLKLKSQELLFKLKVKFCTLLQEISITESDLNKFNKIHKVDEIILFISEKIKQKINQLNQIKSQSTLSTNKDKSHIQQYQHQIDTLKAKINEKDNNEKNYKNKIKQTHAQLKSLYDKINIKEKDYSSKITEIYQLKIQMKEQDKIIENLKQKITTIEKQKLQLKNSVNNKDQADLTKNYQQQKSQLQLQLSETKEQLQNNKEKVIKLQELNSHLNEQLTRWRERFDFEAQSKQSKSSQDYQPQTPNDILMNLPNQLKKSTMSMNSAYINNFNSAIRVQSLTSLEIENTKLKIQLKQLQKQNQQLQRNILNYSSFKEKYEQTLQTVSNKEVDISKGMDNKKLDYLKERSGDLYRIEIQGHYKKKMEQVARQWKEKLYQVVCKYQDDIELLKKDIFNFTHQREISEKKIYTLANEKYQIQTRLIELQKEVYALSKKSNKSIVSLMHCQQNQSQEKQSELRSESKSSEQFISSGSHLTLKPIQEEQSPVRQLPDESSSENKLIFNYYKESSQFNA